MYRISTATLAGFLVALALANYPASCLAQPEPQNAKPKENKGGLVSRFRAATTKYRQDSDEEAKANGQSNRSTWPNLNNPWKKRSEEDDLGSIQGPIALNRALKPTREPFAPKPNREVSTRAGSEANRSTRAPSSPAQRPSPSAQQGLDSSNTSNNGLAPPSYATPQEDGSTESNDPESFDPESNETANVDTTSLAAPSPSSKRELKTYDASPTDSAFNPSNTSRRKANPATTALDKPQNKHLRDLSSSPEQNSLQTKVTAPTESAARLTDSPVEISPAPTPVQTPKQLPSQRLTLPEPTNEIRADAAGTSSRRIPATPSSGPTSLALSEPVPKKARQSTGLDVRAPQLRLRVDGPTAIPVGQTATYTLHATNEGADKIEGLLIRAAAPSSVKIDRVTTSIGAHELEELDSEIAVLWEIPTLAANDSKSIELELTVHDADRFALNLEWTVAPPSTQFAVEVQQPKLELTLQGAAETQIGQPQKYQIQIKNSGKAPLPELTLQLQTETTGQYESVVGPLAPGETKKIDVELTFDHPGLFPIVATAKSTNGRFEQRERIDVQVQSMQLAASWNGPTEYFQGLPADYVLTIENSGNLAAKNLACAINLPAGLEPTSLPAGLTKNGSQLRWSIPSLSANESIDIPLQLMVNQAGEQRMNFQAQCENGPELTANFVTRVEAIADLELTVVEPFAPAPVGHPVIYELRITNRGAKAAEQVIAIAQFSEGIEPQQIQGHSGRVVPGQALFDAIPTIAPKQTVTLQVICQASKAGNHRFRAAVQCPTSEEDLLEEGSTRYIPGATPRNRP